MLADERQLLFNDNIGDKMKAILYRNKSFPDIMLMPQMPMSTVSTKWRR
jgi:hypothetical protein